MGETGAPFLFEARRRVPPPPTTPPTLLDWLAAKYPAAKRQTLRRMAQAGRVTINGRAARNAKQVVGGGDVVVVADDGRPGRTPRATPAANDGRRRRQLDVVYEDADVLVVDKPPGLLTSTVPRERRPTLLALVRRHVETAAGPRGAGARGSAARVSPPRVGLIHRLDRDASGLLVFSKTHQAYLSLKRQLFERSVERVYSAVVAGAPKPPRGTIESRLVERADGTVYSTKRPGEGERAISEYEVLEQRDGRALVRVTLQTGRKHQIRVHLSERGWPIVGDAVYGAGGRKHRGAARTPAPAAAAPRLMLAATKLSFTHPRTGERLTFERAARREFATAFESAGCRGSR